MMTSSSLVHVPFRGGAQALTALLGGQVQVTFDSIPSSIGHIRAGELRPLAVTTATHSDVLPELPTVAEVVPGYEASTWYGLGAPRNTPADVVQSPADVVQSLNAAVNAALADPGMKSRLAEDGRHRACGIARRFRPPYRRRDGEVGPSGAVFRRQAGVRTIGRVSAAPDGLACI